MNRGLLAAAGLLLLAMLSLMGWAYRQRTRAPRRLVASERVLDALATIEVTTYPRPVHRGAPIPGRFDDGIGDEDLADVEHAPLDRLLAATLREEGGLAPRRGLFATRIGKPLELGDAGAEIFGPAAGSLRRANLDVPRALLAVCRRAADESKAELASGHVARALDRCVDGMAWARDTVLGGDLMTAMLARTCITDLAGPAGKSALDASTPDERARARRALGVVKSGLPELGDIVRSDMLVSWLRACGGRFDDASRRRLSAVAAGIAGELEIGTAASTQEDLVAECAERQRELERLVDAPAPSVVAIAKAERYAEAWQRALSELDALATE